MYDCRETGEGRPVFTGIDRVETLPRANPSISPGHKPAGSIRAPQA